MIKCGNRTAALIVWQRRFLEYLPRAIRTPVRRLRALLFKIHHPAFYPATESGEDFGGCAIAHPRVSASHALSPYTDSAVHVSQSAEVSFQKTRGNHCRRPPG